MLKFKEKWKKMYKSLDSLESLCTFASRKTTSTNHNKKQQHENAKRTSNGIAAATNSTTKKVSNAYRVQ